MRTWEDTTWETVPLVLGTVSEGLVWLMLLSSPPATTLYEEVGTGRLMIDTPAGYVFEPASPGL